MVVTTDVAEVTNVAITRDVAVAKDIAAEQTALQIILIPKRRNSNQTRSTHG